MASMSRTAIIKNLKQELSRLMGSLSTQEILSNQDLIQQLEIVICELLVLGECGQ